MFVNMSTTGVSCIKKGGNELPRCSGSVGEAGEACFLALQNPGGSMGEAEGKLGEASYFWGKHAFYVLKKCGKMGEAIDSSTLFIILKRWGRRGPYVAERSLLEFYQQWAGSLARGDTMNSSVCSSGLGVTP